MDARDVRDVRDARGDWDDRDVPGVHVHYSFSYLLSNSFALQALIVLI